MKTLFFYTFFLLSAATNLCCAQWSKLSYMPNPRVLFEAATVGEVIYFGSGLSNSSTTQTMMAYRPRTNQWQRIAVPGAGRLGATMLAASDGNLYLAGGSTSPYPPYTLVKTVDIYDQRTNTFSKAELSEARWVSAVVQVGDLLLFAGGLTKSNPEKFSARVDVYNLRTKSWSLAGLSKEREGMAAGASVDVAVFAGGDDQDNHVTDIVDVYQYKTDTWTSINLSEAKSRASCVVYNNKAYIIGGCFENGLASDKVEIIDLKTLTLIPNNLRLSKPRCGTEVGLIGDNTIVAGGGLTDFTTNVWFDSYGDVDVINLTQQTVRSEQLKFDRINHASIVLNDKFYVAGGVSLANPLENIREVETYTAKTTPVKDLSQWQNIMKVYPNPVRDHKLYIEIPENHFSTSMIFRLLDINGNVILQRPMSGAKMQVPIFNLPAGTYTVSISGSGEIFSSIIVLL